MVEGESRRAKAGKAFQHLWPHEPLGRDVEQAQPTAAQLAVRLRGVCLRRRRIECAGRHAVEAQRGHGNELRIGQGAFRTDAKPRRMPNR